MPHPAQQITLQEYIHTVDEGTLRVGRLVDQSLKLLPQWRLAPVVEALQALRGVAPIVAITTVSEIGDITRFENPRQFMAYLGLVPSEHSSGQSVKRGSITKTGNGHVRRVLVEAAQAYSYPARISSFCSNDNRDCRSPSGTLPGKPRLDSAAGSVGLWPKEK